MRGYDRDQVTDHIRQLEADLAMMAADRDSAHAHADELLGHLDQSRAQIAGMQSEIETLSVPPTTVTGMSERLSRMLTLATEEAGEIRSNAHEEAAEVLSVARQEAQSALAEADSTAARTLELAQEQADKIINEAEAQAAAAQTEAQETTERIAADRAAADREIAAALDQARQRADDIVAAAQDDAAGLRGAAHHVATARLTRSRDLAQAAHGAHQQILDHLDALREHLKALPAALELSDDERALVVTTQADDLDLLNRTLVGRDRFDAADFPPGLDTTDVLEALDDEYTDEALEDFEAHEPRDHPRASA